MDTARVSDNKGMNKENMVYIHCEFFQLKENEVMLFSEQWMQQEIITLNELSQPQKDKYHKYSLICGS